MSDGLVDLRLQQLEMLRAKVSGGEVEAPLTLAGLASADMGKKAFILDHLGGLEREPLLRILDVVIAERKRFVARLDLVWTGPESKSSEARDTWVVMGEMLKLARKSVIIAGYAFDSGKELFAPLSQLMMASADLRVDMFLNVERCPAGKFPEQHARASIQKFVDQNWPGPSRYPSFYYDPRTAELDSVASLHAKCVIVDDRLTLIGSANFTDRGQTRNVELGVLIEDRAFSARAAAQWRGLIARELVEECIPA